jgi:hypothetical protein
VLLPTGHIPFRRFEIICCYIYWPWFSFIFIDTRAFEREKINSSNS